jgi:hypothetical protein
MFRENEFSVVNWSDFDELLDSLESWGLGGLEESRGDEDYTEYQTVLRYSDYLEKSSTIGVDS